MFIWGIKNPILTTSSFKIRRTKIHNWKGMNSMILIGLYQVNGHTTIAVDPPHSHWRGFGAVRMEER